MVGVRTLSVLFFNFSLLTFLQGSLVSCSRLFLSFHEAVGCSDYFVSVDSPSGTFQGIHY